MSNKHNARQARHGLKYSWVETRDRIRRRKAVEAERPRLRTIRQTARLLARLND